MYVDRSDFDSTRTKRALRWALSFRRERLGPLHEATTATEYMLGVCLQKMGDAESAEAYFKSAVAHEREAGFDGRIARRCCKIPVVPCLMKLSERHSAERLQHVLDLQQVSASAPPRTLPHGHRPDKL
eukprot:tig00000670_g3028.t1